MPTHPQDQQLDSAALGNDDEWTRWLTLCPLSRMATLTNQVYHSNGYKSDGHPFYETGFNYTQDGVSVYGLFAGIGSARCAKFAASAFPAELVFGQLDPTQPPERTQRALCEAWQFVDKHYLATLNELIVELVQSENLDAPLSSLTDGVRAKQINREVNSIASGVLCAIINEQLFVSYVGECVAILVTQKSDDQSGDREAWDVSILTCTHNRDNEDEKLRLGEQIMVDLEIANVRLTRFLGHPTLKEVPALRVNPDELIVPIQESWKFLVLASPGVFKSLSHLNPDAKEMHELATILCRHIGDELPRCRESFVWNVDSDSTTDPAGAVLNAAVQNVVETLGKMHFRAFTDHLTTQSQRPDMTLMVRVFDKSLIQPTPNAQPPKNQVGRNPSTLSVLTSTNTFSSHGSMSRTMSTLYDTRSSIVHPSNEPIAGFVDFSKFIERMSQDPEIPREWFQTGICSSTNSIELSSSQASESSFSSCHTSSIPMAENTPAT